MSDELSVAILPGEGLSFARFGEPRALHRERLGQFESFERVPGTGFVDSYEPGVMLSYDEGDRLNFIELTPEVNAAWDGIVLTGRPLRSVLAALEAIGARSEYDGDSTFEYADHGVGLYTSAPDEPDEPVEGVSLYPVAVEGESSAR